MAREGGGGGGAFGWTILGVIIGVAGTLAVQTLMSARHAGEAEQPPTSAAVAVVTQPVPPPPPAPTVQPVSSTPAVNTEASSPSHEDVEDDAAAAGMTSRSHTGDADGASSAPEQN